MKKVLKVNTAVLDMLSTKEENITNYDEIHVNCAMCLTTIQTRNLLSQTQFKINTAEVIDLPVAEETKIITINGGEKRTAIFEPPKDPTVLIVNGGLVIEDSHKKKLDQYCAVVINGGVMHPMSFDTSNFFVNGASIPYPDGAVILQGLKLTNSFIRSAVSGTTYFVQAIPTNMNGNTTNDLNEMFKQSGLWSIEAIDLDLLQSKNIHFYTSWVTSIEENTEQLMQITSGFLGNTIIPNGFKIMQGGKLDMLAVRRFGNCIYVDGSLVIDTESKDALQATEQLFIEGNVRVPNELADTFFAKCSNYSDILVYKGEWVDATGEEDRITSDLLENMVDGLTINATDHMEIPANISHQLLVEKIHKIYLNGNTLTISKKQYDMLRNRIEKDDANIIIREYQSEHIREPAREKMDETKINCAYFKL